MNINRSRVMQLINTEYGGNFTRFSKDLGIDISHVHRCLTTGVGGGKKVIGAIIKYCKNKGLDFEEFIEL